MTENFNDEAVKLLLASFGSDPTFQAMLDKNHNLDELLYDRILSLLPGHVYWRDSNRVNRGCNDLVAQDLGFKSRADYIGLTVYDYFTADIAKEIDANDQQVLLTGQRLTFIEPFIDYKTHNTTWISQKIPLINKENKIIGLLGVSLNMTDLFKSNSENN